MAFISGREAYDKALEALRRRSARFWSEIGKEYVEWFKPFDKVMDYNFDIKKGEIYVKFFEGGETERFLQLPRQEPQDQSQ